MQQLRWLKVVLPKLSGRQVVDLLKKKGYKSLARRGSHTVLRKGISRVIIPDASQLADSTLQSILDQAKIPTEKFNEWAGEEKFIKEEKKGELKEMVEDAKDSHKMSFFKNAWIAETRAAPIALLRVLMGVLFLTSALAKAPWNEFGWFAKAVANNIAYPTFNFWATFNQSVIQTNLTFFGWLQFLIELSLGIFLLLGVFTVLMAFFGQFWVLLIWMGSASWPSEWMWTYILWFTVMFTLWTTKAGRSFGLDQIIQDKVGAYEEHSKFYRFLNRLL